MTLAARGLIGGVHRGEVAFSSNDPSNSTATVPVTMTVIGAPDIFVTTEVMTLESTLDYTTSGAQTVHALQTATPPVGNGRFELIADGDFGDPGELATLMVEGTNLGSTGSVGRDCIPAGGGFAIDASRLTGVLEDGVAEVTILNSPQVDVDCAVNRHTVRLL